MVKGFLASPGSEVLDDIKPQPIDEKILEWILEEDVKSAITGMVMKRHVPVDTAMRVANTVLKKILGDIPEEK